MDSTPTIDDAEINRFAQLAAQWWDESGPMGTLHALNPVRLTYIRDSLCEHFGRRTHQTKPLEGLSILDVGAGAGLLCEPLARLGATVTGIDAAKENMAVAAAHARQMGLIIDYRNAQPEDLKGQTWDAVLAMEVVEHVPDIDAFILATSNLIRPGGVFLGATLNRTLRSLGLAVGIAEYVLRWIPRGTHDWRRFVRPAEFASALRKAELQVNEIPGVSFDAGTHGWRRSRDVSVNYMIRAVPVNKSVG